MTEDSYDESMRRIAQHITDIQRTLGDLIARREEHAMNDSGIAREILLRADVARLQRQVAEQRKEIVRLTGELEEHRANHSAGPSSPAEVTPSPGTDEPPTGR